MDSRALRVLPTLLLTTTLLAACGDGKGGLKVYESYVPPAPESSACPLRATVEQRGLHFRVGNLYNNYYIEGAPDAAANHTLLASTFNMISPDYGLAMSDIWRGPREIDYTSVDQLFMYAAANRMAVRGTHLLWAGALPAWLTEGGYSDEEIRASVQWYIGTLLGYVAATYPDVPREWNVVNEALTDEGSEPLRSDYLRTHLGDNYVADAFRWAHAADPAARLFLNDYGLIGADPYNTEKADRAIALITGLQAAGVPIDGVGFQAHFDLRNYTADAPAYGAGMDRFIALGLKVAFTELDVLINSDLTGLSEAKLLAQGDYYATVFGLCAERPACTGITVWGLTDAQSYINTGTNSWLAQSEDWPTLFDAERQPKPACTAALAQISR